MTDNTLSAIGTQEITAAQKKFIDKLATEYARNTPKSKENVAKYQYVFADQRRAFHFIKALKQFHYQLTYKEAKGAYVTDVDGNNYIDISGDLGINLFGHQPEFINEAIIKAVQKGIAVSGYSELIGSTVEMFSELTGHERVMFTQSGTEAVMWAVRIIKAATQKSKIVVFEGAYHGLSDAVVATKDETGKSIPTGPGIQQNYVDDIIVLDYGNDEHLSVIELHANEIAGVLVEPVQSRHPYNQPIEFLKKLRSLTQNRGIPLVFDEMVTGFRVHPKGAQGYFGIQADIATYGKIPAGGMPTGMIAGNANLMNWVDGGTWSFSDESAPSSNRTLTGGTHTQNPIKIAAMHAVLKEIIQRGPSFQQSLNKTTQKFAEELNQFFSDNRLPVEVSYFGSLYRFRFLNHYYGITEALFFILLRTFGIETNIQGNCHFTAAHTEQHKETIITAVKKSMYILMENGFFKESDKQDALRDNSAPINVVTKTITSNDKLNQRFSEADSVVKEEIKKLLTDDLDKLKNSIENSINNEVVLQEDGESSMNNLEDDLKEIISDFLKIPCEKIDINDDLGVLGVDSIMMMGVINQISDRYNIKLSPAKIQYDNNIVKLANTLNTKYSEAVKCHYEGDHTCLKNETNNKELQFEELIDKINNKYAVNLQWKSVKSKDVSSIVNLLLQSNEHEIREYYIPKINNQHVQSNAQISETSNHQLNIDQQLGSIKNKELLQDLHNNKDLEEHLLLILWTSLRSIGLLKNKRQKLLDLNFDSKIETFYERWYQECIRVFIKNDFIQVSGDEFFLSEKLNALLGHDSQLTSEIKLWEQWETIKLQRIKSTSQKAWINLVEVCTRAVPDILLGREIAVNVMFPNSSMHLVEGVYKKNQIADYFNDVLANSLINSIKDRLQSDPNKKIRILEIGAGTGGTTAMILPYLSPFKKNIEEYRYTDLSNAFLNHAKQNYQTQYPFVTTQILNIELPVEEQKVQTEHFDFIIASNVLHATKNMLRTLKNAQKLLARDGMLLLNEITNKSIYGFLTFGLLEGWWLYEDDRYRIEGSPLLNPEAWKVVLEKAGFTTVTYPAIAERAIGLQIITAKKAIESKQLPQNEDIAIVGLSTCFPDAESPNEFWNNLIEKKSSIKEVPDSRWDWKEYYSEEVVPGKTISKWGAFIDHPEYFDPLFFHISPKDAELMDPQERIMLQQTYKAIEDAGIKPVSLQGSKTGVFVGYEYSAYREAIKKLNNDKSLSVNNSTNPAYYLANRVSQHFDFRGPSEAINVNCASSAVSVNRAYYSLLNNESDVAVVGGVCINILPEDYIAINEILSPDGSCRVFDDNANGITKGEGCGVVVLKRLEDAQRDNNQIYSVIKASSLNNRGMANSSSDIKSEAITEVIQNCYEKISIPKDSIDYIEVDGYSAKWADSIEFEAIKEALIDSKQKASTFEKNCALGSIKGNIGHVEPASGIASMIKIALAMKHRQFPATITCEKVNEFIDIESKSHPLYIIKENIAFDTLNKEKDLPVRAGINSFADSGVNVHILIEEYLPESNFVHSSDVHTKHIFPFSAKNQSNLIAFIKTFIAFILNNTEEKDFTRIAYTLQTKRDEFEERLAIIAENKEELIHSLTHYVDSIDQFGSNGKNSKMPLNIFSGNIEEIEKGRKSNNHVSTDVLEKLIRNSNLKKLANYWINDVLIPWESFYSEHNIISISLPTYQFSSEMYWLPINDKLNEQSIQQWIETNDTSIKDFLINYIINELNIPANKVKSDKKVREYGIDSIAGMKLIQSLEKKYDVELTARELIEYPTIESIANYLAEKKSNNHKASSIKVPPDEFITANQVQNDFKNDLNYKDPVILNALERINNNEIGINELQDIIENRVKL